MEEKLKQQYLEAGQLVNTHGVNGELRMMPWSDSAEFLTQFKRFFIDGNEYSVVAHRVHKELLLVRFLGVDTVEKAMLLKGKVAFIDRNDVNLPAGTNFVQDLIGLEVFDLRVGALIGKLSDIQSFPSSDVYVVALFDGASMMIPVVPAFMRGVDMSCGRINVETIDGM